GWEERDRRLHRRFTFRDFVTAMRFVNRMAEVAESEGHHPDFTVHYRQVDVEIWTHAIGGISENDFILAAKIAPLADDLLALAGDGACARCAGGFLEAATGFEPVNGGFADLSLSHLGTPPGRRVENEH